MCSALNKHVKFWIREEKKKIQIKAPINDLIIQ